MGIGKRIRSLRIRAGLTQEELAERIGVTPSAVGNYERDVSHPKEEVLYRLFAALNCEPNDLFADCYDPKRSASYLHLEMYRELDLHGRELVDACTEIEYRRCCGESTTVAARSFGKEKGAVRLRVVKRKNSGSILDEPDYKDDL